MGVWQTIWWRIRRATQLLLAVVEILLRGWLKGVAFLSSTKRLLWLHLSGCVSPYLGLGRSKRHPQEAFLYGGFWWAKMGLPRWAENMGFHGTLSEFWLGWSLIQTPLGPKGLWRWKRVIRGTWLKLLVSNSMWKWLIQVVKHLTKIGPQKVEIMV